MKRYRVELKAGDREAPAAITRKGTHRSQKVINALVLLNYDEGEFNERHTTGREIPPRRNADFAAGMERVLDVYRRPYDANFPVVCMDETPRQPAPATCSSPPNRWLAGAGPR